MMKPEQKDNELRNVQDGQGALEAPAANLRRRNFLLTASLGGVGVAAVAVATRSAVPVDSVAAAAPEKTPGYQLSDHVLHYYRTTRT
jgi:hypothetical protein